MDDFIGRCQTEHFCRRYCELQRHTTAAVTTTAKGHKPLGDAGNLTSERIEAAANGEPNSVCGYGVATAPFLYIIVHFCSSSFVWQPRTTSHIAMHYIQLTADDCISACFSVVSPCPMSSCMSKGSCF